MDTTNQDLEKFKKWWLRIYNFEPSEKICIYYEKGVETGKNESKQRQPTIVVERFFPQIIKEVDKTFFPTPNDIDYCLRAFSKGCLQT